MLVITLLYLRFQSLDFGEEQLKIVFAAPPARVLSFRGHLVQPGLSNPAVFKRDTKKVARDTKKNT